MSAALAIARLQKAFGGLRVTNDLNLEVARGERHLIIGPNGAGKTTLFNQITGEIVPDSGSITMMGTELTGVAARRRTHMGLSRTYQIITLFPNDTLIRNVMLSLLGLEPVRWNPLVRFNSLTNIVDQAREALDQVGLLGIAARPLAETSYGERRRVEIAMAMAQRPKVLLLDEPYAGLSIDERCEVKKLIDRIPRDVTIVMIEHNMDLALDFADRISVMHFGEVIVTGTRAAVVANSRTKEVYLGE
jgi:branched-chain amino acid transport system ATP-binding protein